LNDGMVLIANGSGSVTAELFDPKTMSFSPTPGQMITLRIIATATLLNDGRVLITGGLDTNGDALDTAEIYDPSIGTFSATKGTMTSPRAIHTATLLKNGQVLLAGGSTSDAYSGALDTAEIYNPTTGIFTALTNKMTSPRLSATANRLSDGRVLITGGADTNSSSLATAELFNAKTSAFTPTTGVMSNPRVFHSAVGLPDGRVMIAGGAVQFAVDGLVSTTSTDTVDFYIPSTGRFQAGAPMLSPRDFFTATLLRSGNVLIPAGIIEGSTGVGFAALETAEIYTP